MTRPRIPNGGSAIPRGPRSPKGRYICERTVPTLHAGLTKMFGLINIICGILLFSNGIAVIIIRAGNYKAGAGVWGGAVCTCAGLVALMTGTKRKKVVIACVALNSAAVIAVVTAGIVAGTGIQVDDDIRAAQSIKTDEMKAKIGLNCVTIGLCIVSFFASIFVIYLCGKGLDDAAYAKDVDVSKLYPSQMLNNSMECVNNPVYIEDQTRGVTSGPVGILDPKQPILLVPLKDKQMDNISISYDLTDKHNRTCRVTNYNPSDQGGCIPWDRSVSREDLAHTVLPENHQQTYSHHDTPWSREVAVDIEKDQLGNHVHRQRKSSDCSDIDTVDAQRDSGYMVSPESYKESEDCSDYDHPALSHWNTLASLEMGSESSLGFSDIVKMTPESRSPSLSLADGKSSFDPDEEELRAFAKEFVDNVCKAALDEVHAELEEKANSYNRDVSSEHFTNSREQSGSSLDAGGGITSNDRASKYQNANNNANTGTSQSSGNIRSKSGYNSAILEYSKGSGMSSTSGMVGSSNRSGNHNSSSWESGSGDVIIVDGAETMFTSGSGGVNSSGKYNANSGSQSGGNGSVGAIQGGISSSVGTTTTSTTITHKGGGGNKGRGKSSIYSFIVGSGEGVNVSNGESRIEGKQVNESGSNESASGVVGKSEYKNGETGDYNSAVDSSEHGITAISDTTTELNKPGANEKSNRTILGVASELPKQTYNEVKTFAKKANTGISKVTNQAVHKLGRKKPEVSGEDDGKSEIEYYPNQTIESSEYDGTGKAVTDTTQRSDVNSGGALQGTPKRKISDVAKGATSASARKNSQSDTSTSEGKEEEARLDTTAGSSDKESDMKTKLFHKLASGK